MKNIILNLARNLEKTTDTREWESLPVEEFFQKDAIARTVCTILLYSVLRAIIGFTGGRPTVSPITDYA